MDKLKNNIESHPKPYNFMGPDEIHVGNNPRFRFAKVPTDVKQILDIYELFFLMEHFYELNKEFVKNYKQN